MNTYTQVWNHWAPLVARLFLAIQFAVAAYYKVTIFSLQVAQTNAVGVPFAAVAVTLGLILEVIGVIALVSGYYIRSVAVLLAGYVMLLGILFYNNWTDSMTFGMFVSHLGLTAALLYISVFGTKKS